MCSEWSKMHHIEGYNFSERGTAPSLNPIHTGEGIPPPRPTPRRRLQRFHSSAFEPLPNQISAQNILRSFENTQKICIKFGGGRPVCPPWVSHCMYSMAVAQHALTRRLIGQRSRSHGYENRHGHMAAVGCCCRRGMRMSYDCLGFQLQISAGLGFREFFCIFFVIGSNLHSL